MSTDLIYEPKGRAREYAPLALNLYNGCAHGCTYCYAPSACRKTRDDFSKPRPRVDVIAKLERELARNFSLLAPATQTPVLLCFTTDPYQPLAAETNVTRRAIELLHEYGYPVHILTKGGMRAAEDFDLLGSNAGDAFATTLTFLHDADSEQWEPHAALPADRLRAIAAAHSRGITTWVSLEPVIDPEQSLEIIDRTHHYVDLFKVGTLNYHELAATIDWHSFARRAVDLLEELGVSYYIKNDLRRYLD